MSSADYKLDAQLREVRLPDGLLDRLMALPLAEDQDLDELLRDVAVPPRLLEWLRASAMAEDDGLDEALRNVPVPDDLLASCRHYARRLYARREGRNGMDRAVQMSRIAMAASLILAVTLSLGSAMLLSLVLNQGAQLVVTPPPPLVAPSVPAAPPLETSWRALADDGPSGQPADYQREVELAELAPSAAPGLGDLVRSPTMPSNADPLALLLPASQLQGIHNTWDALPDSPLRPTALVPRGVDWPVAPWSNRPFLVSTGFLPFVSPGANPRLQSCTVPLAVDPSSYELARRYLERNEWPPADRLRTEEFLAAVDYNFPKPRYQDMSLIVAGGPSPISGEGFCLVQVGVQARQFDNFAHAPMHLVLLIDTSTSMRWGSRMEIVRRALHALPGVVGPQDRLSLVTFNQAAHVLVENLNFDALAQVAAAADSLSAEGATNIDGGLREAYGVARPTRGPGQPAVRVVLLTDGLLELEPAALQQIERQVAQAAQQNVPLDVIDLGQQKATDPQVASLAARGRGAVRRAASAEQVRWALSEIVTGRSQVVARAARLEVTFNPRSVLEYRLLGHESRDWDGLLPGPLDADFHDGQSATALFEVRLAPAGPNDLASVELTWYASDGSATLAGKTVQKAHKTVERNHVATSLASAAPSLQAAAAVAYTVEVLRRSPFIFQRSPGLNTPSALFRALELSSQVDSQLRLQPSFDEFVALVRQEMKAHPPAKRSARD